MANCCKPVLVTMFLEWLSGTEPWPHTWGCAKQSPRSFDLLWFQTHRDCGLAGHADNNLLGRVAQSVAHLTQEPEVPIPGPASYTFISKKGSYVSYWRKYVHEVLVRRSSLPWKSVVRLTDRPDMTIAIYRGHKTITQQTTILNDN